MFNANLLKGAIVSKGLTQGEVARKIGISPQTLSRRMKDGNFGYDDLVNIVALLEIDDPCKIFFASA